MEFEDWVDWRNVSMQRFWYWYFTRVVPKKVGPAGGWIKHELDIVLACEWEIQEYDAV